jgi:DNA polymerase/3'-5' exonuclease PolX
VQRHTSLLAYVMGVLPLVEESVAVKIKKILETVTEKRFSELEEQVPVEARAEVLFRTESFLDKNPRRVFDEELLHSLNQLRNVIIRRELTEARGSLEEAERLGNIEDVSSAISRVSKLQQGLQAIPYTIELIKPESTGD